MDVLQIVEIVAVILAGGFVLVGGAKWLYERGVHVAAQKISDGLEKSALILDGVATAAKGAGLAKIGVAIEEFADVPDEIGDVAAKFADMTKNKDFTKERFLELYDEGTEVVAEAKDFIVKVIKTK